MVSTDRQAEYDFTRDKIALTLISLLPPYEMIKSLAEKYLLYCDCQPLPLFHPGTFIATLGTRDPELLLSILALALRFSDDLNVRSRREELITNYAEEARKAVMRRVSEGPIELSTLQSLCLLTVVDFTSKSSSL